jgi:hypothetical protein
MTYPFDPADRWPKSDHNRRLALAMDLVDFAERAGVTPEQLQSYEQTPTNAAFDDEVARKVGVALEKMEATRVPRVDNGPAPDRQSD